MKKSTKKTLTTVAIIVLAVVVIGFLPSLFTGNDDSDFDKINVSYEVGGLTESGDWDEDEECALYTKDAIECTGFELCADFNSNIAFEVHYYGKDGAWISKIGNEGLQLTVNAGDMPEGATSIRIVIRPLNDDNDKIGLFEKAKYANQLTVRITTEEVEADTAA